MNASSKRWTGELTQATAIAFITKREGWSSRPTKDYTSEKEIGWNPCSQFSTYKICMKRDTAHEYTPNESLENIADTRLVAG
jgi:hypothetical protein